MERIEPSSVGQERLIVCGSAEVIRSEVQFSGRQAHTLEMQLPDASSLVRSFLPTRDFELSTRFYEALGFQKLLDDEVAIFEAGSGGFILQRLHDEAWARMTMMQLMVDDLDAWWQHISGLDLPGNFDVPPPKPPAMQPWGLRVAYIVDPAGVLWHIAQRRPGVRHDA